MQLVASLVSVLLLVWSVRATALPGEERLSLQNSKVSMMQELGWGGTRGEAAWRAKQGRQDCCRVNPLDFFIFQTTTASQRQLQHAELLPELTSQFIKRGKDQRQTLGESAEAKSVLDEK